MGGLFKPQLIAALFALVAPKMSSSADSSFSIDIPYKHVISSFTDNVILSRSELQRLVISELAVDHNVSRPPVVWVLAPDSYDVQYRVLFVTAVDGAGAIRSPRWHLEEVSSGAVFLKVLKVDDVGMLTPGSALRIGVLANLTQPDGFFVGFEDGFQPRDGLSTFSGCFKVATGVPFSIKHNDGVAISRMATPGLGYRGWCYRNLPLTEKPDYYLHYFAASSAVSWDKVATWFKTTYAIAASQGGSRKEDIVRELALRKDSISDVEKVRRIRTWMGSHLHYSGEGSYGHIPRSFDHVVENGLAECKGLSLVMMELLKSAGISAHLIITSTENPWLFVGNSSRLSQLNHVAVYLPDRDEFLDATVPAGPGLVGHQAMDVDTGKVVVIH